MQEEVLRKLTYSFWMNWVEGEWSLSCFRMNRGDFEGCWWINSWGRELVCAYWDYNTAGRSWRADCQTQHSRVKKTRHHLSERFVSFSTGATGRPRDHIPRTSLWRLRATLFTVWSRWGPFQHVLHTHQQLPRWSKDRHYASRLWSFSKQWNRELKLNQSCLFFLF